MSETIEQPTAEQIAQNYKAALDSVHLIQAGQPEGMTAEDWADTLKRNKDHLILMLAKTYWTNEDLTPLQTASA
jgi:hypothetical protein